MTHVPDSGTSFLVPESGAGYWYVGLSWAINTDHVKYCQHCFYFDMPSDLQYGRSELKHLKANLAKCIGGL